VFQPVVRYPNTIVQIKSFNSNAARPGIIVPDTKAPTSEKREHNAQEPNRKPLLTKDNPPPQLDHRMDTGAQWNKTTVGAPVKPVESRWLFQWVGTPENH